MPIDKDGSRPEKMDMGPSDEKNEWVNQHFLAHEVERSGPKANDWKPKRKCGLPDQRKLSESYRTNYDKIFGSK